MEDPSSDHKMNEDEIHDSEPSTLIKEVELTVPKTDDPTLPVMTFRMWVLGVSSCVLLSFVNQFMWYRNTPMSVSSICAQIAVVPLGHLMARTITKRVFFQGRSYEFTLNPGPFNIKEHVLITIFANTGAGSVYASHILSAVKLLYKRKLTFIPAVIVMFTTQTLGYGWAGLLRRFLVDPPEMWWPGNLVQVSLFRALHEKEKRARGGVSRTQFFVFVVIGAIAYTVIPNYLFMSIMTVSWICLIKPKSILANQLGSGQAGLGIGSVGFDWPTITSYLGTPLVSPWFATANILAGFVLFMYVIVPAFYWTNTFSANTFPLYSNQVYMSNGSRYDINSIINSNFEFDKQAYARHGPINLSTMFIMTYGLGFATLAATIVHVAIFNGKDIWRQAKGAFGKNKKTDIHGELMKAYKQVPVWWFLSILLSTLALVLFATWIYIDQLQLPWWGVLLAAALALIFTLPIGVISATTNQQPGLNVITEYIIGYIYPGRPVANMVFKVYGYISMVQGLNFVADFKLGHYMKIPPRAMFTAQLVGTIIATTVYTGTAWWLMESIPHLCDTSMLPPDSKWTCPNDNVFFTASVLWGLVGPRRMFGDLGQYSVVNWFFVGGAVAPILVWLAGKMYPKQKWIKSINLPVLLGASAMIPPASAVNYTSWIILAFISGYVVFKLRPVWWERYNYLLSGGLDAGTAFITIIVFFSLGYKKPISIDWVGNHDDSFYCPLASCPTAKGVVVDGCPVL